MYDELIKKTLNSITEAIIIVDKDSKIVYINQSACNILGLSSDNVIGREVNGTIPNTRLHIVLETGKPEYNRIQKLHDNVIITSRIPIRNEIGEVIGAAAVFRDITTVQKLAEEVTNLREIEAMLSAIIDSTNDAISVADSEGKVVLVNRAYTRLTGLSPKEVIGKLATIDIAEGESVHIKIAKDKRPIYGVRMKVGPLKKEVLVNASPIFVNGEFKGSVGVIHDVSEMIKLVEELEDAKRIIRKIKAKYTFQDIVGKSPKMIVAIDQAKKVAKTPATVLLRGESGTGKELFAHAIHNESDRANAPFISVNCAALPETILESELFGYEEGAFTGAKKGGKIGLIEEANNGTLFLDEIGKMSLKVQSKLLRFLQDREIYRIGGVNPIKLDVRIIAATNMNLEKMVEKGDFLLDLYYRLNVVPIFIPPLRERLEDLEELVHVIIRKLNQEFGRIVEGIDEGALELLRKYHWPGNVRELENVLGRAMINIEYDEKRIMKHHIPPLTFEQVDKLIVQDLDLSSLRLKDVIENAEKAAIKAALKEANGNRERAARSLGISVRNLYYKLKKYGFID
ncbi:MAG TPA: sigma-54-dependent transcriptional regulator [Thermotogaceae bacterium]|nr:sigma-54-dependent transcriptional regulator [Thermotogota bacterium]HEW91566.1 sigma-54-dependent transcriptional regulator [Thermotogaceae bacterium]